jgi:hypothetical protein
MEGLSELEQAVLDKLLSGDHPTLAALRLQADRARLVERELTGHGFFCDFEVEPEAPRVDGDFHIADVWADLSNLAYGAAFVLFIRSGRLEFLEGATFGEPWPEEVHDFKLHYDREPRNLKLPDVPSSGSWG